MYFGKLNWEQPSLFAVNELLENLLVNIKLTPELYVAGTKFLIHEQNCVNLSRLLIALIG